MLLILILIRLYTVIMDFVLLILILCIYVLFLILHKDHVQTAVMSFNPERGESVLILLVFMQHEYFAQAFHHHHVSSIGLEVVKAI